ncbi:MAG: hypothetical protein JW794_01750 [Candidatus Cloacimonetes bacterium]|nr:hypothetical protein [Candidatus Cloacimonadota bacterium]
MKKNNLLSVGALIIGSAIIWGAVIIGAAPILRGTPYKDSITKLLLGGVITHFILIWGPMAAAMKKGNEEKIL